MEKITNKDLISYLEALTNALKGYDENLEINVSKKIPQFCTYALKFRSNGFINLDFVLDGLEEEQGRRN